MHFESKIGVEESPSATVASLEIEANEMLDEGGNDQGDEDDEMDFEGEDQGEDDEGEEGCYTLQFDDHTNPLDFAQDKVGDIELYQQFQRLEYEALAERKRKALQELDKCGETVKKPRMEDTIGVTQEEIDELMDFGFRRKRRRRSKALKTRGRKKGSKKKCNPEVTRKIGDATFFYASGDYNEAISLLEEVVRLEPNYSDTYNLIGMICDAKGDRKKALNFYMIAAHLSPKDACIWKKLVAWSIEQQNTGQFRYCLLKAISADPKDIGLRFDLGLLYSELGEYQKAAESYEQILQIYPANIGARRRAAEIYHRCGQSERAIRILEDHVQDKVSEADRGLLNMLITFNIENNQHEGALKVIALANSANGVDETLPLQLRSKEAICHAYLGNMEHTEALLLDLQTNHDANLEGIVIEVADSLLNLGQHEYALKFYLMLAEVFGGENAKIHLKIAQCYMAMKDKKGSIPYFYKALSVMENDIGTRLTLSSLLLEEGKVDETLDLLSPPKCSEQSSSSSTNEGWWLNVEIKLQLAKVYRSKGMLENFVNTICSYIHETLVIETMNRKVRPAKKLTKNVLSERVKLLDEQKADNVFQGFRPVARASDLLKAARAKKSLEKIAALKEEKKAAALAAGKDWQSESEDEMPKVRQEPPLPGFLKDEEHHQVIFDLCKSLASFQRYVEALDIINLTLGLEYNSISDEKKEEFRSLGAQITYITKDPKHGYNYVKCIVREHPYSIAAWNCYYKVVSRFETKFSGHSKFLQRMLATLKDCIMPMIINGNQLTLISQHQAAAEEYLRAYKVQPENPLINLCVGTALINLTLGIRLQNKHYCSVQGFAFLYNYMHICGNSQEAMYNVARAYHHVGLVSLAAIYYEKVLEVQEKDHPIPKLPYEKSHTAVNKKPGYCDLHREAAYNLHLIYKASGAMDLARQVLKNYCTF